MINRKEEKRKKKREKIWRKLVFFSQHNSFIHHLSCCLHQLLIPFLLLSSVSWCVSWGVYKIVCLIICLWNEHRLVFTRSQDWREELVQEGGWYGCKKPRGGKRGEIPVVLEFFSILTEVLDTWTNKWFNYIELNTQKCIYIH